MKKSLTIERARELLLGNCLGQYTLVNSEGKTCAIGELAMALGVSSEELYAFRNSFDLSGYAVVQEWFQSCGVLNPVVAIAELAVANDNYNDLGERCQAVVKVFDLIMANRR